MRTMSTTMHDAAIRFLEALHLATARNLVSWKRVPDDDRDIFEAEVDGDVVRVELVYFQEASGQSFERVLARVTGLKTYFHVAIGTEAYDLISSMLSMHVAGWDHGRAESVSRLDQATARVSGLTGEL